MAAVAAKAGKPKLKGKAKRKAKRKPKAVVLGKKTVTMRGGQRKKVKVKLNRVGRKLLNKRGKLKLYFTVTQKRAAGKSPKRIKAVQVTFKKKKPKQGGRR